jgi:hypothetical protein
VPDGVVIPEKQRFKIAIAIACWSKTHLDAVNGSNNGFYCFHPGVLSQNLPLPVRPFESKIALFQYLDAKRVNYGEASYNYGYRNG